MDPLPTEPPLPSTAPGAAPGRTVIADPAAVRIAAVAARSVPGVYALGGGAGRALGALRDAVGAAEPVQGVRVEVGQTQVAVDVSLVAEYGYPLHRLADAVRVAVYQAVSDLVGLEVIEVNVEVCDVHVPGLNDVRSSEKTRALGSSQL
ncbi:Asp23/Gls24 family envelope stress response protein [Arthrobacter sp. MSA 4-2]|uniref:Asp23/Gls24 family envelope stress response protein n=1 Tax=Arthrobacter sp. MSA 4-2 TaxID=2794349 RepID=UPI0018E891A1|nr:Asp23/Gls24 family envelope stress response protein [Arthrobacter sp. MSA 4-2]MBJ2120749.1 Asp23/Gls24 family envelope stress response protein [Arthrobacter sp. MSA 4-2]